MKIVINRDYGGFGLSDDAIRMYLAKKNLVWEEESGAFNMTIFWLDRANEKLFWENDLERNDPALVEVVERLGKDANGRYASLKVVEIPKNVNWEIQENDGMEWISEVHRTWF